MDYQPPPGQKALVTGASSGIGEGVARVLVAAAGVRARRVSWAIISAPGWRGVRPSSPAASGRGAR